MQNMGYQAAKSLSLEEIVNDSAEKYGLHPYDHLTLYLIANEFVPAGFISFNLRRVSASKVLINDGQAMARRERTCIKKILEDQLGLHAEFSGVYISSKFCLAKKKTSVGVEFSVSKDKYYNRNHMYAKNDYEFGRASGFPLAAVLQYNEKVNGNAWVWHNVEKLIEKEIRKGPKAHLEKAYLLWVPEGVNRDTGELSPASRELCVKYMGFVRKNNPKLAGIVEKAFVKKYS